MIRFFAVVQGSAGEYIAIFLDRESQNKLKAYFGTKKACVATDHLTLAFNPSDEQIKRFEGLMGSEVQLRAIAYGEDENCQSVR